MKILEMIATLSAGGAEAIAADLSKNFVAQGSKVKMFLLGGVRDCRGRLLKEQLVKCGVDIIGIEDRYPVTILNLLKIIKCLYSWRPDVVHCHLYSSEVAFSIARMFFIGSQQIAARTLHNTDIIDSRNYYAVKKIHKIFNLTIACSDVVCSSYKAFLNQSKIDNLFTINNGCTLAASVTGFDQKRIARKALNLDLNKTIIVNIAGFRGQTLQTSQKAHDILIYGFAIAFRGQDDTNLVLAGDGPLRYEAERLSVKLEIQKEVRFLGNISEPWPLLQAADIFVMPSRHEGLPLSLLEACSTGLPVVASDIPEIRKISPGKSWRLCRVNDADELSNALKEVKLQIEAYRKEAFKDADVIRKKYSIKRCADNYYKLFNDALFIKKVGQNR